MTTTDQSFIKAFARDDGEQMPPPPHTPVYRVPPTAVELSSAVNREFENHSSGSPVVQDGRPQEPVSQPADAPAAANTRVDTPATSRAPDPHASFFAEPVKPRVEKANPPAIEANQAASEANSQTSEANAPQSETESPPTAAAAATHPLSAFLPPVGVDDKFRPALEVDQFYWPAITEKLARQMGNEFTDTATRLRTEASRGNRIIAIAGCQRGEGRTTMLLAIARKLSEMSARLAIVDADFNQPHLAEQLGLKVEYGWEDVLQDNLPLAEAVVQSRLDRLAILPLRAPAPQAEQLLKSGQVSDDISVLQRNYDLVLVDLGPVLDPLSAFSAFPLATKARINATVLVHDVSRVSPDELAGARKRLTQAGVTTIGILENFVPVDTVPSASTSRRIGHKV